MAVSVSLAFPSASRSYRNESGLIHKAYAQEYAPTELLPVRFSRYLIRKNLPSTVSTTPKTMNPIVEACSLEDDSPTEPSSEVLDEGVVELVVDDVSAEARDMVSELMLLVGVAIVVNNALRGCTTQSDVTVGMDNLSINTKR